MNAKTPARTRNVTIACAQMACTWDLPANVARAELRGRAQEYRDHGRGAMVTYRY
jgi:hypothetical protein